MRILLFTGKGGVGKTSVAAATALHAARAGLRTLVLSTDPAHSLADAFDVPIDPEPTGIEPRLEAQQIDAQRRLEENWSEVRSYLVALMHWGGVGEIEAEELAVLPGLEEIFSLFDVHEHAAGDAYDLLVVDCAPTAETLRLLSLPDALGWYIERIFPIERRLARVVRPVLGRVTTMPLPQERLLDSVERLYDNLEQVGRLLREPDTTSVRLVVNAEKLVIAEARRTYTYLNLFGYSVDAVVVNRLLPDTVTDPYFDRWKEVQGEHLRAVAEGFAGVPILRAPLFDEELVGCEELSRLGDVLYAERSGAEVLRRGEPLRFERDGAETHLSVAAPFVARDDVDLFRHGEELYVRVGSQTRSIVLPAALRRCEVLGAALDDGRLVVRFGPPPSPTATATAVANQL